MTRIALSLAAAIVMAQASFAGVITYNVVLDGPGEFPANASPGTGAGTVVIDDIANTMSLDLTFSGLTGTVTNSHIHCCTTAAGTGTAGVATTTPTFAGFPSGVTSGTYSNVLDLTLATSYNPSYVSANGGTTASAEAALLAGIASGKAYWNIHSSTFPAGEIRGFLIEQTPEPGTIFLTAGALLAVGLRKYRKGNA